MEYTKEQSNALYVETKRKVLFEDDIVKLNAINQDLVNLPGIVNKEELLAIETRFAISSSFLAGIVGRLSGYFAMETTALDKKINTKEKELRDSGMAITTAHGLAKNEFKDIVEEVKVLEAIVEEYRGRLFALKDALSAIGHKIINLQHERTN